MSRSVWAIGLIVMLVSSLAGQEQRPKAAATPPIPEGVHYEPDVAYHQVGDTVLRMDIARPQKGEGPLPCIVVIHGGGWRGGHYKVHVPQIFDFAKRGYVAATIQYRLVPAARWPAQIDDVQAGVRYLRSKAEDHRIDQQRFGAVGFSAGAHLSMLLGTMDKAESKEGPGSDDAKSSKVQAVVSYFGPTDLSQRDFPEVVNTMLADFLGGLPEEKATLFKAASPVTHIDKDDAPILHFQGTKDRLVPHTQGYLLADAMSKAGLPGRVEMLVGADHGWGNPELDRTIRATFDFFEQHLKGRK